MEKMRPMVHTFDRASWSSESASLVRFWAINETAIPFNRNGEGVCLSAISWKMKYASCNLSPPWCSGGGGSSGGGGGSSGGSGSGGSSDGGVGSMGELW